MGDWRSSDLARRLAVTLLAPPAVAEAAAAGARLIVSGPPGALDPGVEPAAYRILQEALTNARRHAPGAAVDVEWLRTGPAPGGGFLVEATRPAKVET